MLQNLVVVPKFNTKGQPSGCYLVSVGEGHRLAQLLRVTQRRSSSPIASSSD
jgi:ParB family chromosome partitioning protein